MAGDDPIFGDSGTNPFFLSLETMVVSGHGPQCAFWASTPDLTRMMYTNPAYELLFGPDPDERWTSATWLRKIHPDDADKVSQAFAQWRKNQTATIQYRMRRPDGVDCVISECVQSLQDASGQVILMCGVVDFTTEGQFNPNQFQVFNMIAQQMKDSVILTDTASHVVYVNQSFVQTYGYPEDEVLGRSSKMLFGGNEEEFQELSKRIEEQTDLTGSFKGEYRDRKKDGALFWVSNTGSYIQFDDNSSRYFFGIIRDINGLKKIEEELLNTNLEMSRWIQDLENRNRQLTLLNEMGDLMQSCLTRNEVFTVVREYAPKIFENFIGALYVTDANTNLAEAAAIWGNLPQSEMNFSTRDCWALRRGRIHVVDQQGFWLHCDHDTISSEMRDWKSVCIPMNTNTDTLGMLHLKIPPDASFDHYCQLATIVSERITLTLTNLRLSERLHQKLVFDTLTGLYTRPYMLDILQKEFKRASLHQLEAGVAVINVDHFDAFNERLGYSAGDNLLVAISEIIQNVFPVESSASRYFADRYMLLLPHFQLAEALERLERLRRQVKEIRVPVNNITSGETEFLGVTVSIGLAVYPRNGATPEQVVLAAESAHSHAQQKGRDCVVVSPTYPFS
jgi:diguanylate cyclase (GGDEF)-like protein/PAS domain S-box-containing protein